MGSTNFPLLFSDVKTKAKSNSNNSASFNPALLKSNSISEVMEMDDVKSFTKSSKSLLFNSNAFDLRKPESLNLENEKCIKKYNLKKK